MESEKNTGICIDVINLTGFKVIFKGLFLKLEKPGIIL